MVNIVKTKSEDIKFDEIQKLKENYFANIESNTPSEIKESPIFDLTNKDSFKITLTKELIDKWELRDWFATYKKEAMVSTAGIRGAQNVLYSWDTRYPLNEVGIALATLAKALVLKDEIKDRDIHKLCSGEVRFNTNRYIEIISRIQAAQGIKTHLPKNNEKTSIWMTSFLIFMLDYDGGEYVTSSHAMSSKIATKDLDNQGSQFTPEMSMKFVNKIEEILSIAESEGYDLIFSDQNNENIIQDVDGIDLYVNYLKKGIATESSLNLIKEQTNNGLEIMCECVGGCMFNIASKLFEKLNISETFVWNNPEQDPFFHGIGKTMYNPIKKKNEFFDWGCDTTIKQVIESIGYQKLLLEKPTGYVVMMFDPDGDRIVMGQIEDKSRKSTLEKLGVDYFYMDDNRIFAYYTPNKSFFLTTNYRFIQLKQEGLLDNHSRFIIRTAPSALTWIEWANQNNIKVVNVPVGFKEIAGIMKKVESQIKQNQDSILIEDIFGKKIDLGSSPRLLFGGEESGGMITGPENLIESNEKRKAISMREKSAAEASIIISSMIAHLFKEKKSISQYLEEVYSQNNIKSIYDYRTDRKLYNESNPDPVLLKQEKKQGEDIRDKVDSFFMTLALAFRENLISLDIAKKILSEAFTDLNFENLQSIYFAGDGSYFEFDNKFVELRKSGTDALLRAYACGDNREDCINYAEKMLAFSGELTKTFNENISQEFYSSAQQKALALLRKYEEN